jgi:hypothetical protein
MSSRSWLSMPEPPGNTSWLDDLDRPTAQPDEDYAAEATAPVMTPAGLPRRERGATLAGLEDLDAPVPYVPVDLKTPAARASSQAGLAAVRYARPAAAPWAPGERFRLAERGDRYDGTTGRIRRLWTGSDGREHAHVTHADGTLTSWPTARLERPTPTSTPGGAVKDRAPAPSGAPSEPDWDAMAEVIGDFECAACEGDFEASHSAACVDWERERAGTRVISGSNSLVAMDLAEAAATFAKSAEALLQLPADANPEAVRAAFAAARRALDEFEGASR